MRQPRFFTPGQRIPSSVILQYQNGVYTTDYDGERDSSSEEIILLPLVSSLSANMACSIDTRFRADY